MLATIVPPSFARLDDVLGEVPAAWCPSSFLQSCWLLERYAVEWAIVLARELRVLERLTRPPRSVEEMRIACGFHERFDPSLHWILTALTGEGVVTRASVREEVRAATLIHDRRNAASVELYDAAAGCYASVARGARRAEAVLLGPHGDALWRAYFSPQNPSYAISNLIASVAAVNRLPDADSWRILEVGAGVGSASLALLDRLAERGWLDRVREYRLTEPVAAWRTEACRAIERSYPGLPVTAWSLDIDQSWDAQQQPRRAFDLVYGVNVFHLARRLDAVLTSARDRLKTGGWLIAGECIRPKPTLAIGAELVFSLLESFNGNADEPREGFRAPTEWRARARHAGFDPVEIIPDLDRISARYPYFFAAAICGRQLGEALD